MEIAYVDVPDEFSGTVIQLLSERKGELHGMSRASDGSTRLEFEIPARDTGEPWNLHDLHQRNWYPEHRV